VDQGVDTFITEDTQFYEMPGEAFSVPVMSLQLQIDKTQNFSSTDLVYQAVNKAKMHNGVFLAVPQQQGRNINKEFITLSLLTPQGENLGGILVKEIYELLQVPIPTTTAPALVSITHYTESGYVFYQVPEHFPEVFKLVEEFDILVRRELATIRALIPDYSNVGEVRERLGIRGHLFAALYSEDGRWYRARVVNYVEGKDEVWGIYLFLLIIK
jgi:hypothetical protein